MKNKIFFLINSFSDGGAERIVLELADNLLASGVDIELVCLERNNKYKSPKNIQITYLSNSNGQESKIYKLLYLPILAFKLKKIIKTNNVKVVQSHLLRASIVNLLSKIIFRGNHIIQIVNHSIISRFKNNGISGKINFNLISFLYPYADNIISVSKIVENDMQKEFNFKNDLRVIHNPFDITKISNKSASNINDFTFNKGKKYLLTIGRLIELKRNKDLIYALSKLNSNVEVIFIGEGPEKENLLKLAKELNLLNRVHFFGWIENPYKYISKVDILISTSCSESFGNVIVEAMICSTPVISTRSGGPEEIIENLIDGILISIGDINALIKNINLLLNNKNLSIKLITNAKKKVRLFEKNSILCKYKKVLNV